jgi:transposase-like protein
MRYEKSNRPEAMRMHIAACKESGKTVEDYCKEQGIKASNYYYWRKKLSPQEPGKFVRIPAVVSNSPVSIIFANGHRIIFETLPPVEFVKQLVG